MREIFKLKVKYLQNDELDTISYCNKTKSLAESINRHQIVFSTERSYVTKELIRQIILAYIGKTCFRDDSLEITVDYIGCGKSSIIDNVAHMSLISNTVGNLLCRSMDKMQ